MKQIILICSLFFVLICTRNTSLAKAPYRAVRNVLLINSYHQGYAWTDSLTSEIVNVLKEHPEINLYIKYLDAKRFGQGLFDVEKQYILDKYSEISFSGIMVTDNDALDFATQYKNVLFPDIPVVFAGVSNPGDYPLENSDFYGFKQSSDAAGAIDLVKMLFPRVEKLLAITDLTTTGRVYREELRKELEHHKDVRVLFPRVIDEDSICSLCCEDSTFDAIYYFNVNQGSNRKPIDDVLLLKRIGKVSQVPLFANELSSLGKGVIGGYYQSGRKQGMELVKLLLDILNSNEKNSFHHINYTERGRFFDNNELDRFGVLKDDLPEGSYIANRRERFTHAHVLWLTGLFVLLVIGVVILSVVNRRRKVAHRKSKVQLNKVESQKAELLNAYEKLSILTMDLENTNNQLNISNSNLLEAKKKAEESDNLKSAFLANVSHEIRTPLNSIVGFSSLLAEPDLDSETRKMYIGMVESNTESLLVLIDEIIDLSKIEAQQLSLKKQHFSVDILIGELFLIFARDNKNEKIQLLAKRTSETKEMFVFSDRVRVKQIFINLLSNAFKFTSSGVIEFGYFLNENADAILFVRDTGIGISEEFHEVIFHRFRKLNENSGKLFRGTGLGLAITQRLVELLGGKIWLESEPGKGTSFYFTLEGLLMNDIPK